MRLLIVFALLRSVYCRNDDRFNYVATEDRDYGPEDWGEVTCDDVTQCVS